MKKNNPALTKVVIKMNEGFLGEGNAIFRYKDITAEDVALEKSIAKKIQAQLSIVSLKISFTKYIQKFESMGGIAEVFIEGDKKESPSVQCRINPAGETDIISTHDQLLGGECKQVFTCASFPANLAYHYTIATIGKVVSAALQQQGVLGRVGLDFISVKETTGWKHYAIEINLRKGGTTHPFIMIQFLTASHFDRENVVYTMPNGQTRCYFASDNVANEKYIGLTPHGLIDIAICNNLLYDGTRQTGVMFHMIGALSQYGKLGLVCIGSNIEEAKAYYYKTIALLNKECGVTA